MNERETNDQDKKMAKVFAKAWSDESFKEKLLSTPRAALAEFGIYFPAGIEVKILEQTDKVMHIVLPLKPGEEWLVKPMMSEDTDEIACIRCV